MIAQAMIPKFLVDLNVGRLARRLRMLGYDTLFIDGVEDDQLVRIAAREGRILLTKDTGIMKRRIVSSGEVKALLIESADVRDQLGQVVRELQLDSSATPFSRCMACNGLLMSVGKEEIRDLVPPYVFQTQNQFTQCGECCRIYWRGTHWDKMVRELDQLRDSQR